MGRTIWTNKFKKSPEYNESHNLIITSIEDVVDINDFSSDDEVIYDNIIEKIINLILDAFGIAEEDELEINNENEDDYNFEYVKNLIL